MDAKTLAALKGSIKKWEEIVAGTGEDNGSRNCPLCALYNTDGNLCEGCPVKEETGHTVCKETPYDVWSLVLSRSHRAETPLQREAAREMLNFLKGLLPPEFDYDDLIKNPFKYIKIVDTNKVKLSEDFCEALNIPSSLHPYTGLFTFAIANQSYL